MKKLDYKEYLANVMPCVSFGILCGAVTGGAIFLFKLAAKWLETLSRHLYAASIGSPVAIIAVFAVLILCALVMILLHRRVPESKGGGIPRSEGVLRGVLHFEWRGTFFGTLAGSMLSYLAGLPLGSEGPAVLIGTSLGKLCGGFSRDSAALGRYVMTGGAGAGFAVATGAPLSGLLFALEEIHKRFTPMLVLTVSMSVVSATLVNHLLCAVAGISPALFTFDTLPAFSLSHVGWLFLLGILIALAVGIFDASLSVWNKFSAKLGHRFPDAAKIIAVFLITGVCGFCFTDAIYSGHDIIHEVLAHDRSLLYLAGLFLLRLALMLLVTDSGATGGIFIPTLAIGILASSLSARLMLSLGMPPEIADAAVVLGMCAFIGGTLRAPLTAAVLFVELTGQFTGFFPVALVIFTVNAITEMLHQTPFYDRALENLVEAQNHGREPVMGCFEAKIAPDAFVIGKAIRDIMWPPACTVISITRADSSIRDMDNDGDKKLYAGDTIVVRARYFDEADIRRQLHGLVGDAHEILPAQLQ
ncbi:MAG: hypothetical protein E7632_12520 [Ruminococcaceae bacterium]|nr:hypothetical protein [Oscillospiraceae bacterium]